MWGPLLALLQDHEDRVFRQRLEELLCVHPCAVFIQHQGADTQYTQWVADLREHTHISTLHPIWSILQRECVCYYSQIHLNCCEPTWALNMREPHRWWSNKWVKGRSVWGHFYPLYKSQDVSLLPCSLTLFSLNITVWTSSTLSYITLPPSALSTRSLSTLFIRSSSVSAMMPFFALRSAFVTLKGLGRGARPDRSCWVMEALAETLAVTHLRKDTSW